MQAEGLSARRPWTVRSFNVGCTALGLRFPMDAGKLMEGARAKTGLRDFGEEAFVEPLEKLLLAIDGEAQLHPFGRMITRIRLRDILQNKLRAQALFARHPEILDAELPPVLVITGLQRTGTTLLHRLIAATPGTRALHSWEALNPAALNGENPKSPKERIGKARTAERALRHIAPEFFAIHPVEYDAPEEEVLLLDHSFVSTVPEAMFEVPSFAAWVESQDQAPAYSGLVRLLKLLQWQQPGKRWVLKTPHHLEFLPDLKKAIPHARIVHTHRHPLETLPSFCSMVYHSRRIFSDRVNAARVGRHWLRKTSRMVSRAMDFREGSKEEMLDVYFSDLLHDPTATCRQIFEFAGWEWIPDTEGKLAQVRQQQQRHRFGRHRYSLDDYGISGQEVLDHFSAYLNQHSGKLHHG